MGNNLCGWAGKILRVDLSLQTIDFDTTEQYLPQYIGGLGIGLKIMWDEVGSHVKPYDPENLLIFAVGPLTATWAPGAGRTTVIAKSPICYPITHVTRGSFGGHFGAELKMAGYDLVVIKGTAKEPVYLSIKDKKVYIKKALHLWGTDSFAAQKLMIEQEGDRQAKTVAIGQAGEKCSYIASIISETGHANGQGGFGGVMGAKKLKGIVVRGTGAVRIHTPYKDVQETYRKEWKPLLIHSGSVMPGVSTWRADAPNHTWQGNPGKPVIGRVNADEMNRMGLRCNDSAGKAITKYHIKNDGCFGCLFNCFSYVRMNQLQEQVPPGGQISCQQFGSYWPHHSWDFKKLRVSSQAVFLGKQLADMYTINAVELKHIRQFLIYLKNGHGNLTPTQRKELESLPWESENTDERGIPFIRALTENLAQADYRDDNLWGIMSQGVIRASLNLGLYEDIYNGIDPKYQLEYTNNGFGGHFDPRVSYVFGLLWMMENRDFNRHDLSVQGSEIALNKLGEITEKLFGIKGLTDKKKNENAFTYGKIFFTKWILTRGILKDSLTLCDWIFPNYASPLKERDYCGDLSLESKFYSSITGDQVEMSELDNRAEGIWHLQRALTIRDWQTKDMRGAEGYRGGGAGDAGGDFRGHDNVSARFFMQPLNFPFKGKIYHHPPLDRQKYEEAKSMLYQDMGWDHNGAPTRKTLESFKLKEVADHLDQSGLLGDEKDGPSSL